MNILAQVIALLIPTIFHLLHDVPLLNRQQTLAHGVTAAFVGTIALILGFTTHIWASPEVSWWQFVFFALVIHFTFFNYALNRLRRPKQEWFYLGGAGNGVWDRLLAVFGPPPFRVFFQICIFMIGYGVYVHLDWITGTANQYIQYHQR